MVIDTSALIAILEDEPERRAFIKAIEADYTHMIDVATFVEVSIVLETRRGADAVRDLDLFIERAGIEIAPVDETPAREARRAYTRF